MKILQVINNLATGGAEKLLLESLPFYVEKGIKMDVLVLNGTSYPFLEALKNLNCCNVYSLGLHSVYNPIHIFKIIPYFKKYDIVHVHLFPGQYWVVLAKPLSFSKSKLLFTEHSTSNRRIKNKWLKHLDRFFYHRYDKIICITDQVSDVICNYSGLPKNKFTVIQNGVSLSKFKTAQKISINNLFKDNEPAKKFIIQVSSFQEPKDQLTLIKSLCYLPSYVKLILVGQGVLKDETEAFVKNRNLSDRVIFLGLRMDVPQLLKTADIIVLSSKYEGLSLSCIEGMASGRPFIASDVPGLSEVVKDAGILFEQGNSEELAEKILQLLRDKNYYDRVVESCQIRAAQYDIQTMIDKHIALYESLC